MYILTPGYLAESRNQNYTALSPIFRLRARRLVLYACHELRPYALLSNGSRGALTHTHTHSLSLSLPAGGRAINNRQPASSYFTSISFTFHFELSADSPSAIQCRRAEYASQPAHRKDDAVFAAFSRFEHGAGMGIVIFPPPEVVASRLILKVSGLKHNLAIGYCERPEQLDR